MSAAPHPPHPPDRRAAAAAPASGRVLRPLADGVVPPVRGLDGLRRWGVVLVASGVLGVLALLLLDGPVALRLVFAGSALSGLAVLLVLPSPPSAAHGEPLWHPDDFEVLVDAGTGRVVATRGAAPGAAGGADLVGRDLDEVLVWPPPRRLRAARRATTGATFLARWRGEQGVVRCSETVLRDTGPVLVLRGRDVTAAHDERDRLVRRATTDHLTGLGNRAVLEPCLRSAAARSVRTGRWWGVAVVDLDRFKVVNDERGHAEGDRVLVQVAAALRQVARATDDVLRLGGDELVVVARDLEGPDAAAHLAARLHRAVRCAGVGPVTASVGVAYAIGGERPQQLLERADGAMYRAKRSGGDRCCVVAARR